MPTQAPATSDASKDDPTRTEVPLGAVDPARASVRARFPSPGSYEKPKVPPPRCDYGAMWKAAIASGMPANTVADITYGSSGDARWSLVVAGHPELARHVDGADCGGPKNRPCNCSKKDPLCDCW